MPSRSGTSSAASRSRASRAERRAPAGGGADERASHHGPRIRATPSKQPLEEDRPMRSLIGRTTALAALATLVVACAGGGSATPTPPASTPAPASPSSESANPSPSQEAVKLTYFTFSAAPDHLKHLDSIVQA